MVFRRLGARRQVLVRWVGAEFAHNTRYNTRDSRARRRDAPQTAIVGTSRARGCKITSGHTCLGWLVPLARTGPFYIRIRQNYDASKSLSLGGPIVALPEANPASPCGLVLTSRLLARNAIVAASAFIGDWRTNSRSRLPPAKVIPNWGAHQRRIMTGVTQMSRETGRKRRFEVSYQCHMNCDEWRQKVNKGRKEKVNLTTPI